MRSLILSCAVLVGCNSTAPTGESFELQASSFQQEETPTRIDRLTLEEALRRAEERHPAIAEARANVRVADGRRLQAGLCPNPELEARVESVPFDRDSSAHAEPLVGVRQRIPLGGRLGAAESAGEWERSRYEHELERRRLEVRGRVRGSFAAALYSEEALKLLEVNLTATGAASGAVRARLAAGDALPEESARAELEEIRARLERDRARTLRESAFAGLAAAIGEPGLRVGGVEGDLETAIDVPALEAILATIEAGPHVAAALADQRAAEARVELARAQRIPDISLELLYRRLGTEDENAFDAGFGLAIPIFDRNQGRLREAKGEVSAARARVELTRSESEAKVREGFARLSRAVAQAKAIKDEALPRADAVLKAMEARVAAGDAGPVEAAPVRRERAALGLAWLEALREALEARAALEPYLRTP